jgi:serine/threonine protein kinase
MWWWACAGSILLVPGCVQAFLTPQYLAIAMEFASGGDMFEHVVRKGGLKESEARWFFQQLIVGVDYVHKMVGLLLACLPTMRFCIRVSTA